MSSVEVEEKILFQFVIVCGIYAGLPKLAERKILWRVLVRLSDELILRGIAVMQCVCNESEKSCYLSDWGKP